MPEYRTVLALAVLNQAFNGAQLLRVPMHTRGLQRQRPSERSAIARLWSSPCEDGALTAHAAVVSATLA